jgi:uncharacterized metal-binding protein
MPNYKGNLGHRNQTIIGVVALSAIPILTGDITNILIPVGCFVGLKVSPDWDLNPGALGWLGRLLFVDEYAEIVPHRSKISHGPLYGTLIRFALLAVVPVATIIIALMLWKLSWLYAFRTIWTYSWVLGKLFSGLLVADLLHIGSDRLESGIKKIGGNTWKKVNLRRRRRSRSRNSEKR